MQDPEFYIPECGRFEGITEEVYHLHWDAVNNSMLTDMRKTPAHAMFFRNHPQKKTWAKDFGTAVHCALLEPNRFDEKYTVSIAPTETRIADCEKRGNPDPWNGWHATKEYKTWRKEAEAAGYGILSQDDLDKCRKIRDNCHEGGGIIGELMAAMTGAEVSYVTDDPEFDLRCKIRVDLEAAGIGMYVDVKSARNIDPGAFARDIFTYGYYRSHAFYDRQLKIHTDGAEINSAFLVVENEWPCEVVLYHLDDASMMLGEAHILDAMAQMQRCKESGEWPAYSKQVEPISLPPWAFTQEERGI